MNDFQNLLNYNLEESKRLRDEVTDKEIENYKLRKNELKLKEQERNLLTQIKIIQNNINETNTLKEMEQRRADKVHDSMLEKIKNDHEQLKETLDQKRLSYQDLIVTSFHYILRIETDHYKIRMRKRRTWRSSDRTWRT